MNNGGFEFDFSEFNARFAKLALEDAPAAAEKGVWEALSELKNDADRVQPKTPHLHGDLRGDYDLVLEGITQSKAVSKGSGGDKAAQPARRSVAAGIVAKIILRMPYAAKWHEAVGKRVNWSEPGAGPKYLEMKMSMFRKKYFGMIAEAVREALK